MAKSSQRKAITQSGEVSLEFFGHVYYAHPQDMRCAPIAQLIVRASPKWTFFVVAALWACFALCGGYFWHQINEERMTFAEKSTLSASSTNIQAEIDKVNKSIENTSAAVGFSSRQEAFFDSNQSVTPLLRRIFTDKIKQQKLLAVMLSRNDETKTPVDRSVLLPGGEWYLALQFFSDEKTKVSEVKDQVTTIIKDLGFTVRSPTVQFVAADTRRILVKMFVTYSPSLHKTDSKAPPPVVAKPSGPMEIIKSAEQKGGAL